MPTVGPPQRIVGRYAVYDALASGGMATVHLGRLLGPVGFSRIVAIKRLHPQFASDPEFVAMFLDEARLAARIRHPNVVPTLDVVATGGEIFIVMEYVHGESLARLLRDLTGRGASIPPRIGAAILRDVLHGLHAAHDAKDEQGVPLGIVHRDVSPQNIIVGTDGVARVFDFGIAKAAGRSQVTREGQIKGKLAYMAPEQLSAEPVTRVTDVFAASIVLWETLTRTRLFAGDSEAIVVTNVLYSAIRPPSEVHPALGSRFDDVVLKGLARNPAMRFSSARDMALALAKVDDLADPAEVAEWLEEHAHLDLKERATRVADVDAASLPEASFVHTEVSTSPLFDADGVNTVIHSAGVTTGELSSMPIAPRARGRSRRWPAVGGGVVALVAAVIALVALARPAPATPPTSKVTSESALDPGPLPPSSPPIPASLAVAEPPSAPTSPMGSAASPVAPKNAARAPFRAPPSPPPTTTTTQQTSPVTAPRVTAATAAATADRIPEHL